MCYYHGRSFVFNHEFYFPFLAFKNPTKNEVYRIIVLRDLGGYGEHPPSGGKPYVFQSKLGSIQKVL